MTAGIPIVALALAAVTANFITNGNFEEHDGRTPYEWQFFVSPMEGAEATLDGSEAFDGEYSLRLHIPGPYPREPFNNWSQNVMRPLAGERVVVSAAIRTEGATSAEVWVQCFARGPLREIARFTTRDENPVYGSRDWTEVAMTIDIPPDTSFLTVRCVLTGAGTAWFDALSLVKYEPPPLEGMDLTLLEPPAALDDLAPDHLEFIEEMLKANKVLLDTVRELRESNHGLARELGALQGELRSLREDVASMSALGAELAEEASTPLGVPRAPARPEEPMRPVPPLVPVDHELATRDTRR